MSWWRIAHFDVGRLSSTPRKDSDIVRLLGFPLPMRAAGFEAIQVTMRWDDREQDLYRVSINNPIQDDLTVQSHIVLCHCHLVLKPANRRREPNFLCHLSVLVKRSIQNVFSCDSLGFITKCGHLASSGVILWMSSKSLAIPLPIEVPNTIGLKGSRVHGVRGPVFLERKNLVSEREDCGVCNCAHTEVDNVSEFVAVFPWMVALVNRQDSSVRELINKPHHCLGEDLRTEKSSPSLLFGLELLCFNVTLFKINMAVLNAE